MFSQRGAKPIGGKINEGMWNVLGPTMPPTGEMPLVAIKGVLCHSYVSSLIYSCYFILMYLQVYSIFRKMHGKDSDLL